MEKHFEDLDNLKFYMNYYIVMLGLNARITTIAKHPIVSFEDFCGRDLQENSHYPYKTRLVEWKNKFPKLEFVQPRYSIN